MKLMVPPPRWLPPPTSKKWHNRRWWDPFGYLRVRTLSNDAWQRDTLWLIRVMTQRRPVEPGEYRDAWPALEGPTVGQPPVEPPT
jgi:hypothetical protein